MNFSQQFRIPKPAPLVGKVVVLEPLTPEHIPALTEAGADPEVVDRVLRHLDVRSLR